MAEPDDKITVSASMLRELELQLIEDKKRIDRNLKMISLLRGGLREKPVSAPLQSPTGKKSRCVELSKAMRKQ